MRTLRPSSFPESKLFGSKPPRPPVLPPSCLLPTLIYGSPGGSLQSLRKPRLPVFPHGSHFLARKVQGWVRCLPFPLCAEFSQPPPSWAWGVPLGKADLLRSRAEGIDGGPGQVTPVQSLVTHMSCAESCPLKHSTPGQVCVCVWGGHKCGVGSGEGVVSKIS